MHWSPSHYYSGEFQHGLRHGQGEMHYPSGSVYTGEWNKGIRHGTGKMQWVSGDTYQGDWKMGEIHGSGHYRWSTLRNKNFYSSINEYQGEFVKGKRHGQGIFRYADGSCYKGQYKYNQKDSEIGEFTDFTGHLRVGKFVQDQMHARQFSIGLPDWGITQSNLQMELRRYFSFLLQHFRTYKQCFPYDACSSLTRDQFWYLLLPLRKNKIKIYLLDTQLTAALEKSERGSPSDPIPFHVYLKFMLKFHEHWKCLKPPQPTFSNLYAHQRDLVHRIYQKFPSIDLHRLVVWMYRFNPHHDISTCIHAVTEGIPWLIHYQAVFLEYPIVTLEFFQSAYNFFSRDLDINTETGLSVVEEKLEKFFLWVLKSEE
ncbi:hypothetical protein HMI54_005834 [Coelomomyces lativittatus]|nr:hypothetical protein HMI54_005834 [Coelomomyces lativittatus]